MKKDYLEFLTSKQTPPIALKESVRKDTLLSFHAKNILTKFIAFQIVGGLFSMSVCPQFSLGLVDGHGISHVFRMMGDWACGAFCASVFLTSGMLVAFLGMKGEELDWIWRRYKLPLIYLPAIFWGGLMMANMSLNLYSESIVYHAVWILTAIIIQSFWLKFRSLFYLRDLLGRTQT